MERVIDAVGVDEAWRLRGGVPTRLAWPLPRFHASHPTPADRAFPGISGGAPPAPPSPERTAAAHVRLEAARLAYAAGREDDGDREMNLAMRLDPRVAAEGVATGRAHPGPPARG